MKTFSAIAAEAVRCLALEMIPREIPANWEAIDRICTRWPSLTGQADSILTGYREARARQEQARARETWGRDDNAFHRMPSPYA